MRKEKSIYNLGINVKNDRWVLPKKRKNYKREKKRGGG